MPTKRPAGLLKFYKTADGSKAKAALAASLSSESIELLEVKHELCYNVAIAEGSSLSASDEERLLWLLSETFEPQLTGKKSFLGAPKRGEAVLEVGPRLTFSTAWSTDRRRPHTCTCNAHEGVPCA